MARTARICGKTGCPEIVLGGTYCDEHKLNGWSTSTRNTRNPPGWERTRAFILRRDGNSCKYCGATATEVDHVIPLTRGGTHAVTNLVAACTTCNKQKNYKERTGHTWTPQQEG